MKKILILKLGSAVLTNGTDRISRDRIDSVARQLSILRETYHVVIVSSGAIATAKQYVALDTWKDKVASQQALSAIGQPRLMQLYFEIFRDYDHDIAQCLLTYRDFSNPISRENTYNTILELLDHGYIPIVNENDTVAVDEIVLGDNDKLSALLAILIKADILMIATDIDGVYDKNPHLHTDAQLIEEVSDIDVLKGYVEDKVGGIGRGGMGSKIEAAEICKKKAIDTYIVNGSRDNFVLACMNGEIPFTKF